MAESFTPVYNHAEILTLAHVDSALVNWIRGGGCATGTIWMATPSYSHTANSSSSLPHWSATARKSRVALAKFSVPLRDIVTRPGGLDRVWVALSPPSTKPPSSATSSSRAAVQLSIKFTSGLDFGSSNSGGGGVDASISAAPLDFGAVSTSSLTDVQTLEDNSNVGILPPKAPSGTTRPVKVKFVFDRVVVPSRIVLASSSPSSLPTYEPVKSVYLSWKYPVVVVHSSRTVYYETGRTPNIHLSAPADATSNYTSINIDYSTSIDLDMTSQMFAWFRDNLLQICVVANTSDYDSAHSGMDTNSQMHVGTAHIDLWEIMKLVRRRRNLSRSSKGIASPADYMLINPESVDLGGCILSASFTASGGTPSSVSFSADSLPVATNAARPSRAPLLSSSSSSIAQHSQSQLQTHSASSPHTETMSSSGELLPPSRKNIQVSSRSPIPSQDQLSSSSNLQQSMAALEDKNYITFSIIVKKVSNIAGLSSSSEDPSKSPVMHVAFECVTSGGESAGERTWRTNPSTTRKWDQQTFKVRMPLSAVRAIKSTTTSSSPNNSPTMSAVFQLWCSNAINQGGNSTINSSTMQCLGKAVVDLSPLVAGLEFIDGWYHLVHETGQQVGEISVKIVPSVPLGPPPNFSSSLSSSTPGRSVDGNYYHQSPFLYKTTTSSSSPYRSQHVQTFSRNPNFTNNPSNATADTIEQVRKSWGESLKNLAELNEKMKLALASSAAAGAPAMKSLANPSSISHVGIDRMTRSKISPIKKVDVATFVDEVSIAEEELEELVDMAEEMKSVLDETFSLFGDITDGPASSCARLEEAESVEDMDVDSNQQQSSCSSDGGGGANLPTLDNSLENLLMDEIIESAASSHQPGDSNFSPTNVVWPPPHDSTENLAQLGSFKIKTASGRFWCLHGGALALYSGTPVVVRMNKEANLYRTSETWITLQDCQSDRFVRQSDYLLWDKDFGPDVGVAHDFAFMFYPQPDGSFRILNAHGGGYYVGYDQYQDRVMIVAPGDSRIVNWILDFTVADALDDEKSSSLASSGGEIIDGDGGGRHDISDVVESAALDLNIVRDGL